MFRKYVTLPFEMIKAGQKLNYSIEMKRWYYIDNNAKLIKDESVL